MIDYDYDRFGNRYQKQANNSGNPSGVTQSWVEDSDISKLTNRFTLSAIQYDAAGNVLRDEQFRQLQFLYDANGRQRQSSNLDNSNAVTAIYDGAGQRVATKINGTLSVNVYDAFGKLVAEYGQAAAGTGGTQYIFSDQQGTPRVVTNQSGSVLSRHDYQPFGEELAGTIGMRAGTPGYSGADGVKQKYAGMEGDDTGLSHTLWRQYESKSGRWTAPDPYGGSMSVGDPQSFNRYSYVNNDPVNKVDPLGLALSDIGVYQTENPAVADKLERTMVQMVQQNTSQGSSRSTPGLNRFASAGIRAKYGNSNFARNGNGDIGFSSRSSDFSGSSVRRALGAPLNGSDINQLREDVQNLLSNPVCNNVAGRILTKLGHNTGIEPYSTNLMDIFNKIKKFKFVKGPFTARIAGNAGMTFDNLPALDVNFSLIGTPRSRIMDGETMLHELTHASPSSGSSYWHYQMDQAAWDVAQGLFILEDLAQRLPEPTLVAPRNDELLPRYFLRHTLAAAR